MKPATQSSLTGKELIARAIYDHSRRNDRTFAKVNSEKGPRPFFRPRASEFPEVRLWEVSPDR